MWRAFRRSEKDECSKARELLSGYMDQRLSPEEVARVEGHLRICLGCREELESLRATVVLLHRLPEVTPSKSFAVAPVRPVPGRRALTALRFATAGAVLLLVLAFAADRTDLFQQKGPSTLSFGPAVTSEEEEAYWLVPGVRNSVGPSSGTPVDLVVPDHTDNVYTAVNSLAADGVLYGNVVSSPDEVPQVVLVEDEEGAVGAGKAQAFMVVAEASDNADVGTSRFSINGENYKTAGAVEWQNGVQLDVAPATDNNVLYSFNLSLSTLETNAVRQNDWLRPLEYGLLGLAMVLGGAAVALWLRQRRARVVEVSKSQN